ncbi:MAG: AAA family ATPase [Clostridia bacterium]|nr:AAA family ATPase [Clostridia bacterium]
MNLQYILLAAKTMSEKAEKENACGLSSAKQSFSMAAKRYRQAAELDPNNSKEYLKLAEEYERKASGAMANNASISSIQGATMSSRTPNAQNAQNTPSAQAPKKESAKQEQAISASVTQEDVSIEEAMGRLNALTGLKGVKEKVQSWVSQIRVFKRREELGLPVPDDFSYHLVFTGNPGTGKTTVARFMAQIYKGLGILEQGQLVETSSSDLIAGYVGQTAQKTRAVVESAIGGVLFIDEAYTLNGNEKGNEFGKQAIDELLKCMEDHRRELVVIVAGYTDLMAQFIDTNPGLQSRFNTTIEFDDYTGDELMKIFDGLCKKNRYELTTKARLILSEHFNKLYEKRDKNFGNGRTVRNTFQQIVLNQAQRLDRIFQTSPTAQVSDEMMVTITEDDLSGVVGEDSISKTIEYERTKAEINDGVIYGYLSQKNLPSAATALCSRLESLLRYVYNFSGDLCTMINELRSSSHAKAKLLTREHYDCMYRVRVYRNAHVHAGECDVQLTPQDVMDCLKIILMLE